MLNLAAKASLAWSDRIARYANVAADIGVTSVAAEQAREWQSRESELKAIGTYRHDWDGQGSDAPSAASVESAMVYLRSLKSKGLLPPSTIILSPDTGIIFIWQNQVEYVEVEISEPGRSEWMRKRQGRPTQHWQDTWPVADAGWRTQQREAVWEPTPTAIKEGVAVFALTR